MRRATAALLGDCHVGQISIHALHEESDTTTIRFCAWGLLFQSTLSMRRATRIRSNGTTMLVISIHALHEESDDKFIQQKAQVTNISIHALHEESDVGAERVAVLHEISIHALHEESDLMI